MLAENLTTDTRMAKMTTIQLKAWESRLQVVTINLDITASLAQAF